MGDYSRPCLYFEKAGRHNTGRVVDVVEQRLNEGDIHVVVAASTTGFTAGKLVERLGARAGLQLISVAEGALVREWGTDYPTMQPEVRARLEAQGVTVAENVPYVFHNSVLDYSKWKMPVPEEIVRDTLYAFGQGFKVAVEVVLIAVAAGFLEPYQTVIGVGGTSRGADTALVLNATYPNHIFSTDPAKQLRIREVLCRPQ
jgi:hypothetical protein